MPGAVMGRPPQGGVLGIPDLKFLLLCWLELRFVSVLGRVLRSAAEGVAPGMRTHAADSGQGRAFAACRIGWPNEKAPRKAPGLVDLRKTVETRWVYFPL